MKEEEVDNVLFSLNPNARLCSICKRWYDEKIQEDNIILSRFCMLCWYRKNMQEHIYIKMINRLGVEVLEKLYFDRYIITAIGSCQLHFQLKEKGE